MIRRAASVGIDSGGVVGGHLALMKLVALSESGLPQPALAFGLSPWTDIGARGRSLRGNDRYDLAQGWMALRFGEWPGGGSGASREMHSPAHQDFTGLAPVCFQAGGLEILVDMIRDFASGLARDGHEATLDVWPEMIHVFQAHGVTRPESAEALSHIAAAIARYGVAGGEDLPAIAASEVRSRPA